MTNQLGKSRSYGYDAAGNQTLAIDRNGASRAFAYDAANRRTSEIWLNAGGTATTRSFTYAFDADGRQTSVTERDGSGTTLSVEADAYDALARLTSTDNNGTQNQPRVVVSNTYDADGNRATAVTSVNGSTSYTNSYTYDALDRLSVETQTGTGVASKKVSYGYDNAGDVTTVSRYNTSGAFLGQTSYSYDATTGRLTLLADTPWGSDPSGYTYAYDADDRRTLIQFNADYESYTNTYGYDHDGQLTGAASSEPAIGSYDYAYDANGNRTSNSSVVTADNRIASDGSGADAYDDEGNLVQKVSGGTTWAYAYDARERLTGITRTAGTSSTSVTYTYDASDRRIHKLVTGTSDVKSVDERYAYDDGNGDTDLAQVFGGTTVTSLTQRYFYGNGTQPTPLAQETPGDNSYLGPMRWLVTDDQGTWVEVADNNTGIQNAYFYDPYGNLLASLGPDTLPRFQFGGQEYDPESSLYHDDRRYYDPVRGRFLTQDPTGLGPDANPYRFAGNDPVDFTDPTGLSAVSALQPHETFLGPLLSGWGLPGAAPSENSASSMFPSLNGSPGVGRYLTSADFPADDFNAHPFSTLTRDTQLRATLDQVGQNLANLRTGMQDTRVRLVALQGQMEDYAVRESQARLSAEFVAADLQHLRRSFELVPILVMPTMAQRQREANELSGLMFMAYSKGNDSPYLGRASAFVNWFTGGLTDRLGITDSRQYGGFADNWRSAGALAGLMTTVVTLEVSALRAVGTGGLMLGGGEAAFGGEALLGESSLARSGAIGGETILGRNGLASVDAFGPTLTAMPESVTFGNTAESISARYVGPVTVPEGSFSIPTWYQELYPQRAIPLAQGPYRLLQGQEYQRALAAKNAANAAYREARLITGRDFQVHEVLPVKFGGSPTDSLNKIPLPTPVHFEYTSWWRRIQDFVEGR